MAENVFMIHVGVRKRPFINQNRLGNMVLESTRVQEYGNFDPRLDTCKFTQNIRQIGQIN